MKAPICSSMIWSCTFSIWTIDLSQFGFTDLDDPRPNITAESINYSMILKMPHY